MLCKTVDYIASICVQEQYSPYEISVQKLIKLIYKKPKHQINYDLGNKYLELLSADKLSDEEKISEVDGSTRKLASDREWWYGKKSKTLYALKMYNECLDTTKEALKNIDKFHNRADKWLRYRQACCYMGLNNYVEANAILLELQRSFKHWCIYEKLYEIERITGNFKDALKNASIAALSDTEHKLRVSMYENVGNYLRDNNYHNEFQYHYRLVSLLRKEEGWKEDKRVDGLISDDNIMNCDKRSTLKYLDKVWKEFKYADVKFTEGKISKIMEGYRSIFISDQERKRYYFRTNSFIIRPKKLIEGQNVKFIVVEGFDAKKKVLSLEAIDIELI